jgi:DegV family protein with EDD domain
MKRKVGIVVDSTFGIQKEFAKANNITVVTLKVIIDGKEYVDGTFDPELVVKALHEKKNITTSQPTPDQFLEAYQKQLETFEEVICLTLSKSLSGTNNSAHLALTIHEKDNVKIVDSESTIVGGMYMTERLLDFLNEGHSAAEGVLFLEKLKDDGSLLFTVDNLHSLVKSGRIGKVQAFIGNALKVKPILRFKRGVLELEHKVRSFNNVLLYLKEQATKLVDQGKKIIIRIAYVDRSVEAKELQHVMVSVAENLDVQIRGVISPVVSAHVGLGGLGIYLGVE